MVLKYHIREDGNPGICSASVRGCPRGGEDQHYPSSREARAAYEAQVCDTFNPLGGAARAERVDYAYRKLDKNTERINDAHTALRSGAPGRPLSFAEAADLNRQVKLITEAAREAYESMGFHDELISQQSSYHLAAARALDARIRMMRAPRDTRLKEDVKMLDGLAESAYSVWRRTESEVFYGE